MSGQKEMPAETAPRAFKAGPCEVVIHPLVLLSAVDHYNRVAKDTNRRVVGVLLGRRSGDSIDVTNSFAVPFEEDKRDPTVWFVDHNFLEDMAGMFRRTNANETVAGFYSTGPLIRPADLDIAAMFSKLFCKHPVFAIIDVRPDREEQVIPVKAYRMVDEIQDGMSENRRIFRHIPSRIEAYEAEEVGVEHLLRDINDPSASSLADQVRHKVMALRTLRSRLLEMSEYINKVVAGTMPRNNKIMYNVQTILNLLPNLNTDHLLKAFFVKTNDAHLVLYISSIVRSITALHDLVNNKIKYADDEGLFKEKKEGSASSNDKTGKATKKVADTGAEETKQGSAKKSE